MSRDLANQSTKKLRITVTIFQQPALILWETSLLCLQRYPALVLVSNTWHCINLLLSTEALAQLNSHRTEPGCAGLQKNVPTHPWPSSRRQKVFPQWELGDERLFMFGMLPCPPKQHITCLKRFLRQNSKLEQGVLPQGYKWPIGTAGHCLLIIYLRGPGLDFLCQAVFGVVFPSRGLKGRLCKSLD